MQQSAFSNPGAGRPRPDRLIEKAGVSIDRMPMLRVVLEQAAKHCTEELQRMSPTPMQLSLRHVGVGRTGDILHPYGDDFVAAALDVPEWKAKFLVGLDRAFVFTLVETLFGGDGGEPPLSTQRPFSSTEIRLAQVVFETIASSLQACFAPVAAASFKFDRIVAQGDFSAVAKPNSPAVGAKITLDAIERGGEMLILIPQAALSPARPNLMRERTDPAPGRDPGWTKQIETEVGRAGVVLEAVIRGKQLTLDEIADLKVGQVLALETPTPERVRLSGNGRTLFWCQLGQSAGFYTLRVERPVDQGEEFFDDILSR